MLFRSMLLSSFAKKELKPLMGRRLSEIAESRKQDPRDTIIDLLIQDESRIGTIYFIMSEENVRKKAAQTWISFGSDGGAKSAEGAVLEQSTHPRAYGNFARVLGKYVRDEGVLSLEEAVRKMTSLPAGNLKIRDRGKLEPGYFADIVIFDPETVSDHATFAEPHQLATGVMHVFVNGVHTIKDERHTGAKAGRVVRGPGWVGFNEQGDE